MCTAYGWYCLLPDFLWALDIGLWLIVASLALTAAKLRAWPLLAAAAVLASILLYSTS